MVLAAFILSFIISRSFPFAFAALQNVTVDDTYGDPVTGAQFMYSPANHWSAQPGCSGCEATANATDAYNHTWHDTSFFPTKSPAPLNASISFTGSAVYVYCIISHSLAKPNGYTDLQFMIDGEIDSSFIMSPNGMDTYTYNYAVYANDKLPMAAHTLTIINGQMNGSASLILLDYVVYTTETVDKSPTASTGSMEGMSASVSTDLRTVVDSSTTTRTVMRDTGASSTGTVSPTTLTIKTMSTIHSGPTQVSSTFSGTAPSAALSTTSEKTTVSGTVASPAHDITPAGRITKVLSADARTIVIAASVGGGILLLVIAAVAVFLRRRRYAKTRSCEQWDLKGLPSHKKERADESGYWQRAQYTTDRPMSIASTFHDRGSDDDPSWIVGGVSSSHGWTSLRLPAESSADVQSRVTGSSTLGDSVIDVSAGRRYSNSKLRLQRFDAVDNSYIEALAQDCRGDAILGVPLSRRTTTEVTDESTVGTPTSVADYIVPSPSAAYPPIDYVVPSLVQRIPRSTLTPQNHPQTDEMILGQRPQ